MLKWVYYSYLTTGAGLSPDDAEAFNEPSVCPKP